MLDATDADVVGLTFEGGGSMSIPSAIVPGLEQASESKMETIVLSPAGDALPWPSLDEQRKEPSAGGFQQSANSNTMF